MSLRTKSALCLAAAAVLAGLPAFPQDAGLSRLYYYGLYQEIGLGDIAKAIETYRRATEGAAGEKSALAGKALLRMGLCCEKMGKRLEARDAFKRAIANFSAFPSIVETASEGLVRLYADRAPEEDLLAGFISRGRAAAQQGDLEGAKKIFKQAYSLNSENSSLQRQLAVLSKRLGQNEEAIYYYQRVVESPEYRSDFAVYRELAECYRQEGRSEEAIRLWGGCLEPKTGNRLWRDRVLFELELAYERADASTGEVGDRAVPADLRPALARAEEETRAVDYQAANETYRAARDRFGGSYLPPARLAYLYETFLDKPTIAVWYYKEALSKAPPLAAQRLRSRLARLLVQRGAPEEAARYLDQYFSRDVRPLEVDPALLEFLTTREEWKGKVK